MFKSEAEYHSTIKKKFFPCATSWMDLEGITFTEISQTQRPYCIISLICEIYRKEQTNECNKNKIDSQIWRQQKSHYQWGEGGRGQVSWGREFRGTNYYV